MNPASKAYMALLRFVDYPKKVTALARLILKHSFREFELRGLFAAAGVFAKDNESYFLRYDNQAPPSVGNQLSPEFDRWLSTVESGSDTHLLIFRKPNEPRMRVAYEVLAGWVLKFLYKEHNAIPIDYANGAARIWWPKTNKEETENIWESFQKWLLLNYKPLLEQNIETLLTLLKRDLSGTRKIPLPGGEFFETISSCINERGYKTPLRKKVINIPPFWIDGCLNDLDVKRNDLVAKAAPCLFCGSPNGINRIGVKLVIPESKKIWIDSPGKREHPTVCPECFFAALVSGFYPSEDYSVCELPVSSIYQTFVLAQRLSNITASLSAMIIARSVLLTVLPSRYFLVRLTTGQGVLPKKIQLYLLLTDYSSTLNTKESAIQAYVEAAGAINYLDIHIGLLQVLSLFKRGSVLPSSFVKESNAKTRANNAVLLLEAGKPYAALYALIYDSYKESVEKKKGGFEGWSPFKSPSTLETYDETVQKSAKSLLRFLLKGGKGKMLIENPEDFYRDVKELSDSLYNLLKPIVEHEVNSPPHSKVSVVVHKYVDAVEKKFPQLSLTQLQYMVAKTYDDAEKSNRVIWGYRSGEKKNKESAAVELEAAEAQVVANYDKYFKKGNAYIWREFVKETSQRLLARLLLGVRPFRQ